MKIPLHIAMIMDGNGRWARKRNLPRVMGHREGAKTLDSIIALCGKKDVKHLTLYSFSTENWRRPRDEVEALMGILEKGIRDKLPKMLRNGVRFRAVGRKEGLPRGLREAIEKAENSTAQCDALNVNFAINYGGRQELLDAARGLALSSQKPPSEWTLEDMAGHLYTRGQPDPDLVIRTSGEFRTSNFLLWQAAYAEYYITDTLWPDFGEEELQRAIDTFTSRERRFGG
ncbi:MAG: di-trans,poly-cis-decaprenylcistransferase [Candidatus Omnitrophica bacterium]|nr:di-trans,poly-cis-decaprenylcistransferase [Candidatus Omnitrophota bacterium]